MSLECAKVTSVQAVRKEAGRSVAAGSCYKSRRSHESLGRKAGHRFTMADFLVDHLEHVISLAERQPYMTVESSGPNVIITESAKGCGRDIIPACLVGRIFAADFSMALLLATLILHLKRSLTRRTCAGYEKHLSQNKKNGQKIISPCVSNEAHEWIDTFVGSTSLKPDILC